MVLVNRLSYVFWGNVPVLRLSLSPLCPILRLSLSPLCPVLRLSNPTFVCPTFVRPTFVLSYVRLSYVCPSTEIRALLAAESFTGAAITRQMALDIKNALKSKEDDFSQTQTQPKAATDKKCKNKTKKNVTGGALKGQFVAKQGHDLKGQLVAKQGWTSRACNTALDKGWLRGSLLFRLPMIGPLFKTTTTFQQSVSKSEYTKSLKANYDRLLGKFFFLEDLLVFFIATTLIALPDESWSAQVLTQHAIVLLIRTAQAAYPPTMKGQSWNKDLLTWVINPRLSPKDAQATFGTTIIFTLGKEDPLKWKIIRAAHQLTVTGKTLHTTLLGTIAAVTSGLIPATWQSYIIDTKLFHRLCGVCARQSPTPVARMYSTSKVMSNPNYAVF